MNYVKSATSIKAAILSATFAVILIL